MGTKTHIFVVALFFGLVGIGALVLPRPAYTTTPTPDAVEIMYPVEARLFGVINTTIPLRMRMHTDGSFTLDYPWYGFVFSTDRAQLEVKLQAVGKAVEAWQTTTFSPAQQQTVGDLLKAALEGTSTAPELQ